MTKIKRLENILFLVFLGLLPFNVRYIFNFQEVSGIEGFREHLTRSLFLFDLPLLALLVLIGFEAYALYMYSMKINTQTYELRDYSISLKHIKTIFTKPITYLLLILLISSIFSQNLTISFFNSARILMAASLFLVAVFLFSKRKSLMNNTKLVLFFAGVFQAIVGIFQFVLQQSLGLKFLGESLIAPNIPGVAKFEFAGEKFIRAYGTFPHPNVFGFFLLISLAACFWLIIKHYRKQNLLRKIILLIGLFLVSFGILLSYSRSVISSMFVLFFIMSLTYRKRILAAYTLCCQKLKVHKFFRGTLAIVLIFSALFVIYNLLAPRLCVNNCAGDNSFSLRAQYNKSAFSAIATQPLFGVGPGNFVVFLEENFSKDFRSWEFQPVHNLYLLIASEIGLLGLICFLIFVLWPFSRSTFTFKDMLRNPFVILSFLALLVGFVDHYFWTHPQGQMFFWLSLAFLIRDEKNISN